MPQDWLAINFNPSFLYRLVHMVIAAYLATRFAIGAYHLMKDNRNASARLIFSMAMLMAAIVTPIQIAAGDVQVRNTLT